jgi:serine/threonine protein phosphatase PrpC
MSETTSESADQPAREVTSCPQCAAPVGAGERYCEACGAELPTDATAPSAGPAAEGVEETEADAAPGATATEQTRAPHCHECGGVIAADGYCTECGAKARSPRDHFIEQPAAWVAASCDRGVRHTRNEDAVALDARADPGSHAVLVVCDGVSNSIDSDIASLAAARAARDLLAHSTSGGIGTAGARVAATAQALEAAADAANDAVVASTIAGAAAAAGNPASCTFVAAVVDSALLVVGWVGDSRAYWVPDTADPQLLTVDDSFAAEQIAQGVARAEAETGPQAHAITRWLGSDSTDHVPHTASMDLLAPGWVLVCSDGLWNYCSEPADLTALVHQLSPADLDPLTLAEALVDWANAQGGADNITVALARIDPPTQEGNPDGHVHS